MPENRAPDYADKIAAELIAPWSLQMIDADHARTLIAMGVREGYKLASGVTA